jgi:hypothetical protein
MLYKSKLRGSFGRIYPVSLVIVYILCLFEVLIRWSLQESGMVLDIVPAISISAMGLFFLVMGIIQRFRYGLWIYPVLGFFAGLGCILAIFIFDRTDELIRVLYFANILVIILIVILTWPVLSSQEKYEMNARRMFKLAAEHVAETSDGFTQRPFTAGRFDIKREDLLGFVRMLDGKHIARSFIEGEVVFLTFSLNRSVLTISDPRQVSYVSMDAGGALTVKVSESDYRQYRASFNFDQLCASMASVFVRFMTYYSEGKEQRILNELKTAR